MDKLFIDHFQLLYYVEDMLSSILSIFVHMNVFAQYFHSNVTFSFELRFTNGF